MTFTVLPPAAEKELLAAGKAHLELMEQALPCTK